MKACACFAVMCSADNETVCDGKDGYEIIRYVLARQILYDGRGFVLMGRYADVVR